VLEIGSSLRSAREGRGLSLDDAAEATKIRSRRLAKQQRTWLKRFRGLKPGIAVDCSDATTVAQLADACTAALAHA